jgi:hypothetical protein
MRLHFDSRRFTLFLIYMHNQVGNSATAAYVLSSGVLVRFTSKGALRTDKAEDGFGASVYMFGQVG